VRKIVPKRIEVITEYSTDGLPLYVDAVEFRQVLINLTLNAVDAMPRDGKIRFETSLHQTISEPEKLIGTMPKVPVVCLEVTDTGDGIPARYMRSIFDPFFTTKAMSKGAGLGLYNARLFVEKHRGALSVESQEKVGTTFRLWLPQADFTEKERDEYQATARRNTLLVIGQTQVAEPCAKFLREHGFYTVVTAPGDRAVELLNSPDYQFDGVMGILTAEDMTPADIFDRLAGRNANLRKILQVVGCNQDELDHQILIRADVVITPDISGPDMISKLTNSLAK
jgi:two-component system, cell cycle sensor histidine kinase and response regulator CckA